VYLLVLTATATNWHRCVFTYITAAHPAVMTACACNGQDYIVDEWTWIDLSGLGSVTNLEFSFTSTDNGAWGMNNPGYFAMDNFNGSALDAPVPEPMSIMLLGLGGLLLRRRKT